MFSRINIVPRWIIFCIDLSICAFALFFAYLLRLNFDSAMINYQEVSYAVLMFSLINCVVFFSIKSYAGIIRYTSAQDSFRILVSIIISNSILFFINLFLMSSGKTYLIPTSVIIINGLTSFLLLITYRVLVKYFFMYIKNMNITKRRVIIYGAGEAGLTTKRTLDHDPNLNMAIVAFIDDNERKVGKVIDGVKIYSAKQLKNLITDEKIDDLIISTQLITANRKIQIVDLCLEQGIRVLNVPPFNNWINGQLRANQIQNIKIEDLLERDTIEIHNDEISAQLKNKRVLITGAAGSIGSELVRQIARFNPQLIVLSDQSETPLHDIQLELQENNLTTNFHTFIGDVRNPSRMKLLFETFKPQYVYHAAAYKHVPMMENNPAEAIRTNVLGTKIIADLSVKHGVQKFVMISTDKAVNPTNVMGASKRIAEIYVQSLYNSFSEPDVVYNNGLSHLNGAPRPINTKFITTRFGNVLGSNGSVIPRFKTQIERGGPITVTHPEITRYFMTIPEACQLVLEAGAMGKGGEIFVFDMGKSVKIVELAKKMIRLLGLIPNQDIKIEFTGLRPGEKLYEELLNDLENTIPTHHDKIMIAKVREYYYTKISEQINDLITLSTNYKDTLVVKKMKEIVPEFISNNSIYEELDVIREDVI